jgi:hypothetical protein
MLPEGCKTPENIFYYFCQNSCAITSLSYQRSLIYQQKFKEYTVEGKLCQLPERDCTSTVRS